MQSAFLTNYTTETFLERIRENLRRCKAFWFSVSFIKKAGLVLLNKDIEAAVARGCHGKLITSTYQNFTDIESLSWFRILADNYSNFTCHLDFQCFHDEHYSAIGYHSKGYIFEFDDYNEIIVGSSNITRYALLKNIEWDLLIRESSNGSVFNAVIDEFNDKWGQTHLLSTDIIRQYAQMLNYAIERWDMDYDLAKNEIKPNYMQRKALKEINRYRATGEGRVLIVAAAGSGKTYLAAFDALNFNPGKLLYIVHEGSILKKSLETFETVFGNTVTFGVFSGEAKELNADFIFATNQMMYKSLSLFSPEHFDYIIIDECHHAAANSYKSIINHFKPEFFLGLTATPERMDNQDVFELFDKNVPFQLRLRDAIINDLVVPFKYYGIRDKMVEYGVSKSEERRMVAQLATDEHCEFIRNEIEKHRSGGKLKALAFCRNVTHARMMCEAMGEIYHTAYLTGKNDVGERLRAYQDLQSDTTELEILFTVDILNEGVDIPGVNMVLFLRPTESSTIFIQQLGRGLRKCVNKAYVTVLDFIGNSYKRSVQIAFALGSMANNFILEKKLLKDLVRDDFEALYLAPYGVEIHIDDLSKEEIIHYIDNENFNALNYIRQDFCNFRAYMNEELWPKHMDYLNNDCAPDLLKFMSIKIGGRKTCSYYSFLNSILDDKDKKYLPVFDENQIEFIEYLSKMLPLVRLYEYIIVNTLLVQDVSIDELEQKCSSEIADFNKDSLSHALKYMTKSGFVACNNKKFTLLVSINNELRDYLDDLISYGLTRYDIDYPVPVLFKLWQSYRMDQVQLKLCKDPGYTMKGTYIYEDTVIAFASLKKDASLEEHLKYKDKFLAPNVFQWECEAGLKEVRQKELIESRIAYLFIRKVEQENGIVLPFTYVGTGRLTNPRKTDNIKGSLLFDIHLDESLPDDLQYDFGLL